MIENLLPRQELLGFSRQQSQPNDRRTIKIAEREEAEAEGWEVKRRNKHSFSLTRPKRRSDLLESRVWTVLYRMGFPIMSGKGGALVRGKADGPTTRFSVVAVDDEVALAIDCRSSERPRRDKRFSEKIAKLAGARRRFANAVAKGIRGPNKRHTATIMFVWDIGLSEKERQQAEEDRVYIFDNRELEYFEELVKHLGPAAKYQFLSTVCRGKKIPGLKVIVPALQTKMGRHECYCFSIEPEYLLKIAYVAHRARGKAIDIDAYQRLIKKSRLRKIRDFISDEGLFPTNIVVNIANKRYAQFDRGEQKGDGPGGRFGWLTLAPSYGTAWIIDGQHRLFAYSGHERASTSYLNVLAFSGLSASMQTQLFVEINSEQKRVPRSLLVELDSNLKWDAEDEATRIHAVVSRAGLALDEEPLSPLRDRVLLTDARRTHTRCVSLASIASALSKPGFFIAAKKKGVTDYGPLWRDDPKDCLRRTVTIFTSWLSIIADRASDWWSRGSGEGGGLAMNDGVTVCINMLRSVLSHLRRQRLVRLAFLEDEELIEVISPFATALGDHFARMSADDRLAFRGLRGVEGQTTGRRMAEEALREEFPDFQPPGLDEWIQRRMENTNEEVRRVVDAIEMRLQQSILALLKAEFPSDLSWWFEGVPKNVRKKVDDRINEQGGGEREEGFDLIDYRSIVEHKWELLRGLFGHGPRNSAKSKQTKWLHDVNEMRKVLAHPSRRTYLSASDLQKVQEYEEWLDRRLAEDLDA